MIIKKYKPKNNNNKINLISKKKQNLLLINTNYH